MTFIKNEYLELISSSRVSQQTREILLTRLQSDNPDYKPMALTQSQFKILRHLLARIIPQRADPVDTEINLAARLDNQLVEAKGDGWRYAALPSDVEACRVGLSLLDEFSIKLSSVPFVELEPAQQDGLIQAISSGRLQSPKLDLELWFQDLCANATQIYVSHPQTQARMGYTGFADNTNGFVQLGIGKHEAWEPDPQ